jgi:hypothetical protein
MKNTSNNSTRKTRARRGAARNTPSVASTVKLVIAEMAEKKVYIQSAVATSVVTTGTVINVSNNILEGDELNQRTGQVIRLKRLRFLFRGTAVTTSASVRFVLLRDMLNTGTTPAVTDFLSSNNWISAYRDNRQIQQNQFKVIKDLTMDLNIAGENILTKQYDMMVKGVINYNGPSATASANGPGSLFLLVIGNSITTAYDYTIQVVYTDL